MSRPRVLVVDDDEHIRFVATRALEPIAECDSASDVAGATRALRREAYDVVLVDISMPGPSGMTLLDEIREHFPQSSAVMLSGLTDLSVAQEALERGALGYIVKPFRVPDLRIQVTAALGSVGRSTAATRASARARVVTQLAGLIDRGAPLACVVVELEHVSLLNSSYAAEAVKHLCARVDARLRDLELAIGMLDQLGPSTFVAALTLPPDRTGSQVAHSVHRILTIPIAVNGQRIPIAARLGLAVAAPGESADSILNLAENAAGAARDGGLPFVVYDGDLRDSVRMQLELLADATTAICSGGLHVEYQPQYHLESGTRVGIEALARWHHPTRGDIPPAVFVPLAERMDLIGELGAYVLRTACNDLARLRRDGVDPRLRVSVNVSTSELRDVEYRERVANILREAGLPASSLRLEITESIALDDSDDVARAISGLHRLGVELSVDDFGTGYASFANLARLPLAEIKLDRSMTAQCHDARGREMLRAVLKFGTALDADVIAEGIETTDELNELRKLGCRYGQGFLLGRPQSISDIAADSEAGGHRRRVGSFQRVTSAR